VISVARMNAALAGLVYKNGWTFSVYTDEWEGPHIFIVARLPNSYKPSETLDVGVRSAIPPMETVADFHRWLMWRIIRIESHEAREFLRYSHGGGPVFDPHKEGS
jgi:hypothetical protein